MPTDDGLRVPSRTTEDRIEIIEDQVREQRIMLELVVDGLMILFDASGKRELTPEEVSQVEVLRGWRRRRGGD